MTQQAMQDDRITFFDPQTITLEDFPTDGWILDIGGGGEGVIGQLKARGPGPCRVIAIDPKRTELEEAPPGPLKVVMDARQLQFLDGTFATTTAFFTFMYIPGADHLKVMKELHRVLAPGGRFYFWDWEIPHQIDRRKEIAAIQLTVRMPGKTIKTGYGAKWPEEPYTLERYTRLAEAAGFQIEAAQRDGRVVRLTGVK